MDNNIKKDDFNTASFSENEQYIYHGSPTTDEDPDEYYDMYVDDDLYDDNLYDDEYYKNQCMSCIYWLDGVCGAEQGVCNYEPF